jgi:hypothetical protein
MLRGLNEEYEKVGLKIRGKCNCFMLKKKQITE